ncbi:uncharacterized protein LOC110682477 [Chenopodium quinoa]|uniref:uncharacterized protein LOC110682477 n=1 Tax=Chenopodium quinoa TaxID=63459 RepID=UPI000B772CCD|nr:uncharacterized protein LOC110682477 [Chenopodium quinoa]
MIAALRATVFSVFSIPSKGELNQNYSPIESYLRSCGSSNTLLLGSMMTRLLERMAPSSDDAAFAAAQKGSGGRPPCSSVTKLQAVLVAADCNSRWLTKHLPSLASSRNVPIIFVKDNKEGSLRLGEVVKVKTAVALGVKVKGSSINQLLEEVLHERSKELNA